MLRITALLLTLTTPLGAGDLPLSGLPLDDGLPLHTVYTAPSERSLYLMDQGYRLELGGPETPLRFTTDTAGEVSLYWKRETLVVANAGDYLAPPRLRRSYSDSGRLEYEPLAGLRVVHDFAVFSSTVLIQELEIANSSEREQSFVLYAAYQSGEPVKDAVFRGDGDTFFFSHEEPWRTWASYRIKDYKPEHQDMLLISRKAETWGGYSGGAERFLEQARRSKLSESIEKKPRTLVMGVSLELPSRSARKIRIVRAVGRNRSLLWSEGNKLLFTFPFDQLFQQSAERYSRVPPPPAGLSETHKVIYWQGFSIALQNLMQPEGEASYHFFLESREPAGGADHEGPDLASAVGLLTLAHADPSKAQDVLRLFMSRQRSDGYIPRRVRPYPPEKRGKVDTSAAPPIFAWLCWEVYEVSRDKGFLQEAYSAASRFANYLSKSFRPQARQNGLIAVQQHSLARMAGVLGRSDMAAGHQSKAEAANGAAEIPQLAGAPEPVNRYLRFREHLRRGARKEAESLLEEAFGSFPGRPAFSQSLVSRMALDLAVAPSAQN